MWSSEWGDGATPDALLDVPVRIDGWDSFDALFAWDRRRYGPRATGSTWMGAALRSFFGEGGRTAYVVALGRPLDYDAPRGARTARLDRLVRRTGVPQERASWTGYGHLFGLEDVSFVLFPDLPELVAEFAHERAPRPARRAPEGFVECSRASLVEYGSEVVELPEPRCLDFRRWVDAIADVRRTLAVGAATVHVLAALPTPADETARRDLFSVLGELRASAAGPRPRLQVVSPWLVPRYAVATPGGFVPADGALAGVLARNALTRGTFMSVGGERVTTAQALGPSGHVEPAPIGDASFDQSITTVTRTPGGIELDSDAAPSLDPTWRFANTDRFMSALVAECRRIGEQATFELSGEQLWQHLRTAIESTLERAWIAGALRGASRREAFDVRCDRTTMTQNDIDAGRAIVAIRLRPAAPIDAITVRLDLAGGPARSAVAEALA